MPIIILLLRNSFPRCQGTDRVIKLILFILSILLYTIPGDRIYNAAKVIIKKTILFIECSSIQSGLKPSFNLAPCKKLFIHFASQSEGGGVNLSQQCVTQLIDSPIAKKIVLAKFVCGFSRKN